MAKITKKRTVVALIDCRFNKEVCEVMGIERVPTALFFKKAEDKVYLYDQELTQENVLEYLGADNHKSSRLHRDSAKALVYGVEDPNRPIVDKAYDWIIHNSQKLAKTAVTYVNETVGLYYYDDWAKQVLFALWTLGPACMLVIFIFMFIMDILFAIGDTLCGRNK